MEEWETSQVGMRLKAEAEAVRIDPEEFLSLKLRPIKSEGSEEIWAYFGGFEYAAVRDAERRAGCKPCVEHETGPEWLMQFAEVGEAIGGISGAILLIRDFLSKRGDSEPRGSEYDLLRVELRRFDDKGEVGELVVMKLPLKGRIPADLQQTILEAVTASSKTKS